MRSGEQSEQRAQPEEEDSDGAVTAAKTAFQMTAAKQLKGLMAQGVDPGDASTELLDELTMHRAGKSTSTAMSSPHMQHVVAATGCSSSLAMRTLLLKDEIAHLRWRLSPPPPIRTPAPSPSAHELALPPRRVSHIGPHVLAQAARA